MCPCTGCDPTLSHCLGLWVASSLVTPRYKKDAYVHVAGGYGSIIPFIYLCIYIYTHTDGVRTDMWSFSFLCLFIFCVCMWTQVWDHRPMISFRCQQDLGLFSLQFSEFHREVLRIILFVMKIYELPRDSIRDFFLPRSLEVRIHGDDFGSR